MVWRHWHATQRYARSANPFTQARLRASVTSRTGGKSTDAFSSIFRKTAKAKPVRNAVSCRQSQLPSCTSEFLRLALRCVAVRCRTLRCVFFCVSLKNSIKACEDRGSNLTMYGYVFIAEAIMIYSLVHGLRTLTAVPISRFSLLSSAGR